jgi:hypothetical protein
LVFGPVLPVASELDALQDEERILYHRATGYSAGRLFRWAYGKLWQTLFRSSPPARLPKIRPHNFLRTVAARSGTVDSLQELFPQDQQFQRSRRPDRAMCAGLSSTDSWSSTSRMHGAIICRGLPLVAVANRTVDRAYPGAEFLTVAIAPAASSSAWYPSGLRLSLLRLQRPP